MQLLVYATTGLVATLVHFGVLVALVEGLGTVAPVATGAGALAAAMVAFVGHLILTFGGRQSLLLKAMPRFMLVAMAGAFLNSTIVWGWMTTAQWHYLDAQFVATGFALVLTYQTNRAWTLER